MITKHYVIGPSSNFRLGLLMLFPCKLDILWIGC